MIWAKRGSEEALWKNKIKEHWTEGKVLFFSLLLIFLNTFAFLCSFLFLNVVIWRLRMKIKLENNVGVCDRFYFRNFEISLFLTRNKPVHVL